MVLVAALLSVMVPRFAHASCQSTVDVYTPIHQFDTGVWYVAVHGKAICGTSSNITVTASVFDRAGKGYTQIGAAQGFDREDDIDSGEWWDIWCGSGAACATAFYACPVFTTWVDGIAVAFNNLAFLSGTDSYNKQGINGCIIL